ncbi:MAG: S8 family serine peptidase [Nanoarchaeota archaeon]
MARKGGNNRHHGLVIVLLFMVIISSLFYLSFSSQEHLVGERIKIPEIMGDAPGELELSTYNAADQIIPGVFVVKFTEGSDIDTADDALDELTAIASGNALLDAHSPLDARPVFNMDQGDVAEKRRLGMHLFYEVKVGDDADILRLVEGYARDADIASAEPAYIGDVPFAPDDIFYPRWHHNNLQSALAWDVERGSPDVVIAVIDTDISYHHEDLVENMWQNLGEDADGDGAVLEFVVGEWQFDQDDVNGVDDDGNGFADDFVGWNFVDDNNQVDVIAPDHVGHGTRSAGAASAVGDNGIGVVNTCMHCQIMGLKSYGGHWVIAPAIEYAVDNGAGILSMSVNTPETDVMHAAVLYAYNLGRVQVSAAGNENLNYRRYPAAYPEVIAVGATEVDDSRVNGYGGMWGSNFGSWVDVAAPGVSIRSTQPGDVYEDGAGTSIATPLVSGIIGLVKSRHPEFSVDQIMTLVHSAVDPVTSDYYFGTGRINAFKALSYDLVPVARIDASLDDQSYFGSEPIEIRGSAFSNPFLQYTLEYGLGPYPDQWHIFASSSAPVIDGVLGTLDPSELEVSASNTIRLIVYSSADKRFGSVIDMANIFIDPSVSIGWPVAGAGFPPLLVDVDADGVDEIIAPDIFSYIYELNGSVLDGWPETNYLSIMDAGNIIGDERTELVGYGAGGLNAYYTNGTIVEGWPLFIGYVHSAPSLGDVDHDGYDELVLAYKLTDQMYVTVFNADGSEVSGWPQEIDFFVDRYYFPSIGDIDGDGLSEIVFASEDQGEIIVYHHDGSVMDGWPQEFGGTHAPAAIADIDDDGLREIFIGSYDQNFYAFRSDGTLLEGWPKLVGEAVLSSPSIGDIDDDGDLEIIGGSRTKTFAWENDGSIIPGWPIEFDNPLTDSTSSGLLVDITNDGRLELVTAVYEGIQVYSAEGSLLHDFEFDSRVYTPAIGDIDRNGALEMIVVTRDATYAFIIADDYDPHDVEWSQYVYDAGHTGYYSSNCPEAFHGSCSGNKPDFCLDGEYIQDCEVCGCPPFSMCMPDGSCMENPDFPIGHT